MKKYKDLVIKLNIEQRINLKKEYIKGGTASVKVDMSESRLTKISFNALSSALSRALVVAIESVAEIGELNRDMSEELIRNTLGKMYEVNITRENNLVDESSEDKANVPRYYRTK